MRRALTFCILPVFAVGILLPQTGCGTPHAGAVADSKTLDLVVDANELAGAFEKSAERAAEVYTGKRARISGYFARMETLEDGRAAIIFKTSADTYRPLRCINASPDFTAGTGELDDGSPITVDGTIGGFTDSSYFVTVENCTVH